MFKNTNHQNSQSMAFLCNGDSEWGNSICCDFKAGSDTQRFYGWKSRRPEKYDYIEIKMKSGKTAVFYLTEVKHETNPSDMFFATGKFRFYKEDQNISTYNPIYESDSKQKVQWFT